jgi:hypothetical protein
MSLEVTDSYIDAFGNIAFNGFVVKIDLVSLFPDQKDPKNVLPRLTGRVVTSIAATSQLRDSLNKMFADLQKAQEENKLKASGGLEAVEDVKEAVSDKPKK